MLPVANERLERASTYKRQTYYALEDLRLAGPVARIVGTGLFVLIVLNAVLVFAETQPDIPERATAAMTMFGLVSSVCFALEYAARLWVADLVHPNRKPAAARIRYMLSLMGIIDLLSFLPGLLVLLVPMPSAALNAARIIRLIRLVKISRYMRGLKSISRVFQKRSREIVAALTVLALLTVTASVLMYEIENPVQPEKFDSVFTGMYWAMTTITTTGYGDLVPITGLGRFVGFMTMLLSIGVVAIPAGIFSAGFVSEFRAQDAEARERLREAKGVSQDNENNDDEMVDNPE
ncbi:MAG: ion transporter [Gordonibacter sp.]|nr:ion transporter [Gordonibacter sp.]